MVIEGSKGIASIPWDRRRRVQPRSTSLLHPQAGAEAWGDATSAGARRSLLGETSRPHREPRLSPPTRGDRLEMRLRLTNFNGEQQQVC